MVSVPLIWMIVVGVSMVAALGHQTPSRRIEVVHSWKQADYAFPSLRAREAMIRMGLFQPKNIAFIDVDVFQGKDGKRKVFVTTPRMRPGTPASLSTVTEQGLLRPYPEWSWHKEGRCDGITSVFRTQIDECDRLWVLDTGVADNFSEKPRRLCPPQILLFNVNNDQLIGRHVFPDGVVTESSLLVTIAVDTRGTKCRDTFAYIADVVDYKLVVFDANTQRSWRVSSNYFYPYPLHGTFHIANVTFDLMDGVLGLALGPMSDGDRRLYWHSLASVKESWVRTSLLRNESLFADGENAVSSEFRVSRGRRPSQSAAESMTPSGILFFGLLANNSIACWNSRLPYSEENIITVAKDDVNLQFVSGMKLLQGTVYMLSSRLQNFITNSVPEREINYRIVAAKVDRLIDGTSCQCRPSPAPFHPPYRPAQAFL